jgi:hypothetical protein
MNLGIATIRLTALFLLVTSFSDYWVYDRWDPAAPMNSSDLGDVAVVDLYAHTGVSFWSANLPDDRCICCSPLLAPSAPVVPQPGLIAPSRGDLPRAPIQAAFEPLTISTSPPGDGPTEFDRPLRL